MHAFDFELLCVAGTAMPRAACPPSLVNHTTFIDVLARAGAPLRTGSCIVNIGAKLPDVHAGKMDKSNLDWAWELARFAEVRLGIVAFESNDGNFEVLRRHATRYASRRLLHRQNETHSVQLVKTWVSATSIASMLRSRGVRNDGSFALLKLDIDSCDLSIAHAILDSGLRPTLIWAEHNQHVPLPIEFAAVEPVASRHAGASELRATYGHPVANRTSGYRGSNKIWGCFGVSLGAWASFAAARGYIVLLTLANNVLLMRSDAHSRGGFFALWTDDVWCHAATTQQQLPRLHLSKEDVRSWGTRHETNESFRAAIATITRRCREHETPYTLRINGQCCPGVAGKVRLGGMPLCQCS